MGKKLFVGNLPFSITEGELGDLFAQVGAVESVRLITDRDTGRKKGFGFVEMAGDKEADDAIARFNGAQLNGRPLVVNEARPPEKREGGGGGYRGGNGGGGGGGGDIAAATAAAAAAADIAAAMAAAVDTATTVN